MSSETRSNSEGNVSRRDFLKYVGAAGAVLGLSSLPFTRTFAAGSNATNVQTKPLPPEKQTPSSPHTFNLDATTPQFSNTAGSRTFAMLITFQYSAAGECHRIYCILRRVMFVSHIGILMLLN